MTIQGPIQLNIDVTGRAGALSGPAQQAVTVFLPDPRNMPQRPIVIFALPGGGCGRGYWCLETEQGTQASQARWHAERGIVFVAADHLGAGESTTGDPESYTMDVCTRGSVATVQTVLEMLQQGRIGNGFPALENPFVIGIGQSMGGFFTLQMQGQFALYSAIGILGYSCLHTVPVAPPDMTPGPFPAVARGCGLENLGAYSNLSRSTDEMARVMLYTSFWLDEERAVLAEKWITPAFSKTFPGAAKHALARGVVAEEASRISCPVFLGFGERDVSMNPRAEPDGYLRANDIRLVIVPHMTHGQNFNKTREGLWKPLHNWALWVASPEYA
jgi:pimeloyl-ACP methyl ester carboxylesterase